MGLICYLDVISRPQYSEKLERLILLSPQRPSTNLSTYWTDIPRRADGSVIAPVLLR